MINYNPSHVGRKKAGELWSTNKKVIGANVDPPKLNFSTDYISAVAFAGTSSFYTRYKLIKACLRTPRAASRWALPHISSFLFFSARDLRAPSADRRETLPYDRNMGALYNASPKIRGPSPERNWGPKACKIRRDFKLQTSIANISGMGQDIQNLKTNFSPAIPAAF